MSPRTRDALTFTLRMLNRRDVTLALFCAQFGSALMMSFSSAAWLAIPLYVLAGFDGWRFIRLSMK